MSDMLNARMMATMRELESYPGVYWFRQASCKKLVELGYAEAIPDPSGYAKKLQAHRLTGKGFEYLNRVTDTSHAEDGHESDHGRQSHRSPAVWR
jgi:hypothetical protein